LLVEAEAAEKFVEAFQQLTLGRMKAALNSAYRTQLEETTARAKQATKPAATPRMSVKKEAKTPKTPAIDNSQAQAGSLNVWQEIPKLPLFSGLPEKDASFSRWQYEVTCLLKEQQPQNVIRSAIRKSLKSPAADVIRRLGEDCDIDHVLSKFQSLYGTVLAGEAILQKFYGEKQTTQETCAEWSCRLEDYMFEALEQGVVSGDTIKKALCSRFWSGLSDERVKNALRQRDMGFEELVVEARKVEEEYHLVTAEGKLSDTKSAQVKAQHTTSPTNEKLDMLFEKLKQLEIQVTQLSQDKRAWNNAAAQEARCRPPQQQPPQQQQQQQCQPYQQSRPKIQCHKCHLEGHLAFGCRSGQNVTCYKCSSIGHIAASCLNL